MCHDLAVAYERATGAPEADIEITSNEIEAIENAFRDWYGEYNHALELGGTGDVFKLLTALMAACPKACIAVSSMHADL
jgi:hypothetical protein